MLILCLWQECKRKETFFWSLSLNSDCFPIEPKKSISAQNAPEDRRMHCLPRWLICLSDGEKKINTFFLKRVTARGESSLSLSDWWNCIKVSYPPLSSIFILVTLQTAGVQCSASTSIIILSQSWEHLENSENWKVLLNKHLKGKHGRLK